LPPSFVKDKLRVGITLNLCFQYQTFEKQKFMLKPSQCRAARALLEWTQSDLAGRTSISAVSIRAFEKGGDMRDSNLRLLTLTFEAAGIIFQDEGEMVDGGVGVRLRRSSNPS
jgi:DNA-binding XRE family transcriptional regulator